VAALMMMMMMRMCWSQECPAVVRLLGGSSRSVVLHRPLSMALAAVLAAVEQLCVRPIGGEGDQGPPQ
jgi:hypothetical protein